MNWLAIATPWLASVSLLGSPLFAYAAGPPVGYGLFLFSLACALVGLPANLWLAWRKREPSAWGRAAVSLLPLLLALATLALSIGKPMINDVATDLENPPTLRVSGQPVPFPDASKRELAVGGPKPWLTSAPVEKVQAIVMAVIANRKGWALEQTAPGRIKFVATSRIFRFKDDVVVRIEATPDGTRVDVRSRSRMGKGDMGANAKRIDELLAAARTLLPG